MSYQNLLEEINRQVADDEMARQRTVEATLQIERMQSEHQQMIELMEYDHEQARQRFEQAMLEAERTLSAQSRLTEMLAFDEERNRQAMLEAERTLSAQSRLTEMLAFDEERNRQAMLERTLSAQSRLTEILAFDEERNRQAMLEAERTLSAQSRLTEILAFDEERNRQAMLEAERTLSAQSRLTEILAFDEERNRQAMLEAERTLSACIQASQELQPMMHERMASLIEGTELAQEQKQRMLLEREEDSDEEFTELHSLDESQWVEVIKFAQQKNRYSKIEIVKGRVVNTAWTLTPSVCFELIKFLISDGDQQLIYLMEKIKDLPVAGISKVLEEIRKNIDGFLL